MENVSALQSFDLNARPENFEANWATDLFLLSLDFFPLALSEAILLLRSSSTARWFFRAFVCHAHWTFVAVSRLFKFEWRDRVYDVFDFIWRRYWLTIWVEIFVTVKFIRVGFFVNILRELSKKLITLAIPVHVVSVAVFVASNLNAAARWSLNVESVPVRTIDGSIVGVLGEDCPAKAALAAHILRWITHLLWLATTCSKVWVNRLQDVCQLSDVVHAHWLLLDLLVLLINLDGLSVDV